MVETLSNRLPEIEIDFKNPFKGDRLGREQYAVTLANIVNAYSETGCVISVNGEWGTGKFFISASKAPLATSKPILIPTLAPLLMVDVPHVTKPSAAAKPISATSTPSVKTSVVKPC